MCVSQGDAQYTSARTWLEDARLCSRHFLHRSRLKFFVDTAVAAFEEPLPEELVACLEGLQGLDFGLPGRAEMENPRPSRSLGPVTFEI